MPHLPLPPPPRLAHVVCGLPGKGPPRPPTIPPTPHVQVLMVDLGSGHSSIPKAVAPSVGTPGAPETPATGWWGEIRPHWKQCRSPHSDQPHTTHLGP